MLGVLAYRYNRNLGDAIQTVALCRLLGRTCVGVYRDEVYSQQANDLALVVNGWLGYSVPCSGRNSVFAGVHIGGDEARQIAWVKESGQQVGARDPYTQGLLAGHRVASSFAGCATLTFDRYRGPRKGRYSIDVEPRGASTWLTNRTGWLSWPEQWRLALQRLDQLRRAEIVYTNRLHVILPCLAFGTPVSFPTASLSQTWEKHRLTILGALGFEYDTDVVIDTGTWSETYRQFLATALNTRLPARLLPPLSVKHCHVSLGLVISISTMRFPP